MKTLIQPGDLFSIRNRRMSASGEIVKVNRTTFSWRSTFFDHPVSGKIELHELHGATIERPNETAFTIL
jgi:hypothetical protein